MISVADTDTTRIWFCRARSDPHRAKFTIWQTLTFLCALFLSSQLQSPAQAQRHAGPRACSDRRGEAPRTSAARNHPALPACPTVSPAPRAEPSQATTLPQAPPRCKKTVSERRGKGETEAAKCEEGAPLGLPQAPLSPLSSLSEPSTLPQAPLGACSLTPAPSHTLRPCPFHTGCPQHPSGPTPSPQPHTPSPATSAAPRRTPRSMAPLPWLREGEGKGAGRTGNARPCDAQRAPRRAGSECAFPVRAARGSASLPAAVAAAMKDVPGFLQQSQSAGPGQAAVWHRLEELYNKK